MRSLLGACLLLVLTACDESADTAEIAPVREPPAPRRLNPPDEPGIVHGDVDVVAAPTPTKFRGPFPDSLESFNRGTTAYMPWSHAHAALCSGDESARSSVLEAMRRAAEFGELTGDIANELDAAYFDLLSWCRTQRPCDWLADVAMTETQPALRTLAWELVADCPAESVRPAMESNDSPDGVLLQWYRRIGAGGESIPPRLHQAAERMIAIYSNNTEPDRFLPLAQVLIRFSDPAVGEHFDWMIDAADEPTQRELYRLLVERPEAWAKARVRQPCRTGFVDETGCLPPVHPYDSYLFEDAPAFAASSRRFERTPLLDRLDACVSSRETVDAFHRGRCLSRLARLDWRRAVRAAQSLRPEDGDASDPEIGPVIDVLLNHVDEPLEVVLRRFDLIGSSPDPEAPVAEGIDALSVMIRYGRARTVGTKLYEDAFNQTWAMYDLARLHRSLRSAAFDVLVDPASPSRRVLVGYIGGRRYSHGFSLEFGPDSVRAMLTLLNGMLADANASERFVVARMDDIAVSFAYGNPAKLAAARQTEDLFFLEPDAF